MSGRETRGDHPPVKGERVDLHAEGVARPCGLDRVEPLRHLILAECRDRLRERREQHVGRNLQQLRHQLELVVILELRPLGAADSRTLRGQKVQVA